MEPLACARESLSCGAQEGVTTRLSGNRPRRALFGGDIATVLQARIAARKATAQAEANRLAAVAAQKTALASSAAFIRAVRQVLRVALSNNAALLGTLGLATVAHPATATAKAEAATKAKATKAAGGKAKKAAVTEAAPAAAAPTPAPAAKPQA
jgi:hypothetical protein